MSNVQKTLDSLQPYVIGIRYLEGVPVIDVVFKEGWSVIDDPRISKAKGSDEMNYYMIYSEVAGVGIDDLLSYVDKIIKLNQDREKKHDLLRDKVNELKEIFKKNPLSKLKTLVFKFAEEELLPSINDLDDDTSTEIPEEEEIEEPAQPPLLPTQNIAYVDEEGKPIELTEEEKELIEEEQRAERNRKMVKTKKVTPISNLAKNIELPPKNKPTPIPEFNYETGCSCSPNEACDKCIDSKGL